MIIVFISLVSLGGIFICLLRPFHPDNTRIFARIFSWGGAAILGLKIRCHNFGGLRDTGPCVYVVNHQHNLDLIVCGRVVAKRTVTIGKKSLRFMPFFGLFYWLAGNIFIDRENQARSRNAISASTRSLTRKNTSIWVFAEGTRNRGRNLLPFKKGAFVMAVDAGVPVVPICVSSYPRYMNLRRLRSGVADIKILPPVMTEHLTRANIDGLMRQCWEKMQETIAAMDQEAYAMR